jgi:hypothetical protein
MTEPLQNRHVTIAEPSARPHDASRSGISLFDNEKNKSITLVSPKGATPAPTILSPARSKRKAPSLSLSR